MKHATASTLLALEPILIRLRELPQLAERRPGIFYRTGKAFLHFHEDPAGVFADVRLNAQEFTRLPVQSWEEAEVLLRSVQHALGLDGHE